MYLAPIVRARPASPALLRAVVGAPLLLLTALVMLAWLTAIAAGTALVLGSKALLAAPHALAQAVNYAGQVALGR